MSQVFRTAEEVIGHHFKIQAAAGSLDRAKDQNSKVEPVKVQIDQKPVEIYPWGKKNNLPQTMVDLLRSNSDLGNLLDTQADFLYGSGIGLFKKSFDQSKNEIVLTPYWSSDSFDMLLEMQLDEAIDEAILNMVQLNNAFLSVKIDGKDSMKFESYDSTTIRAGKAKPSTGKIEKYVFSNLWASQSTSGKYAKGIPVFDYSNHTKYTESIVHLRSKQPGQFYYAYSIWWSLEDWIEVANLIAPFYKNALKTEGNLGNLIHVAKKYFDDVLATNPKKPDGKEYTFDELVGAFDKTMDELLFGTGKRMNIRDICAYDANTGNLVKLIDIEPVKKSITGSEYMETYNAVTKAMSNAGMVLGGLSGLSDGKMNSGGGTEIRMSALYQQHYRTPRERRLILDFLNRVVRPYLQTKLTLPKDVIFDFKNILLETLDQNKSGVSENKTNQV